MISLIHYDEFGSNMGFPSIKESFEPEPYRGQEQIADYLDRGKPTYVTASFEYDCVTGERIPIQYIGLTDGEYSWNSVLSYYVRKYNLRLTAEFENKVLRLQR